METKTVGRALVITNRTIVVLASIAIVALLIASVATYIAYRQTSIAADSAKASQTLTNNRQLTIDGLNLTRDQQKCANLAIASFDSNVVKLLGTTANTPEQVQVVNNLLALGPRLDNIERECYSNTPDYGTSGN